MYYSLLLHTALDCHFYDSGGEISLSVVFFEISRMRSRWQDNRVCNTLSYLPVWQIYNHFCYNSQIGIFFTKKVRNGVLCLIIFLLAFAFHYIHQQLSTLIVHLYFTLSLSFMSFRRAKGPKRPAHGKVSLPAFCSRAASSIFQSSRHCLLNCSFDSWVVRNSFS